MIDQAERSCVPMRDVVKLPRFGLGAALLGATMIAFTTDVTPAAGQTASELVRSSLSSGFAPSSRVEYLQAAIGIKRHQADAWVAYVSSLQAYREAVRNAREEEVLRLLNDGINTSAEMRKSKVDTAKRDLKARYKALYAALDRAQRRAADQTLTAGECGR